MDERDNNVYRNKGLRHTCIKTIMENVEFKRRIYEFKTEDGKKAYKFLLDEYLQMDTIGHISSTLVEKIIDNVTNVSYRNTSTGCAMTNGGKAIQSFFKQRNFTDLIYR